MTCTASPGQCWNVALLVALGTGAATGQLHKPHHAQQARQCVVGCMLVDGCVCVGGRPCGCPLRQQSLCNLCCRDGHAGPCCCWSPAQVSVLGVHIPEAVQMEDVAAGQLLVASFGRHVLPADYAHPVAALQVCRRGILHITAAIVHTQSTVQYRLERGAGTAICLAHSFQLESSRWMLVAGCWLLDAGCWLLDACSGSQCPAIRGPWPSSIPRASCRMLGHDTPFT